MPTMPSFQDLLDDFSAEVFVGRGEQLAILRGALVAPRPPFLILSVLGQGGVGKSTLLGQFQRIAADHQARSAPDHDETLYELTRRYFTSHGQALVPDFVWWSGLTAAQVKRGLEMVMGELTYETIAGKEYWSSPNARPLPIPEAAYLLPNYDEYMIAYARRDDFYDAAPFNTPVTRDNAPFAHMIVWQGRIVGVWKRTLGRDAVALETRFLHPPSADAQRALAASVKRYGSFWDCVLSGRSTLLRTAGVQGCRGDSSLTMKANWPARQ